MSKKHINEIYEAYIKRDDKVIKIGELTYYRIIDKTFLSIKDGTVLVCVPQKMFKNRLCKKLVDENGKCFKIGYPAHFSFNGDIPKWYKETVTFHLVGTNDINEVGEYLTLFYGDIL